MTDSPCHKLQIKQTNQETEAIFLGGHEIQYNTISLYYKNKLFLFLLKMQSSRSTSEITSIRGTDVFLVLSLPLVTSATNLQTLQLS